VTRARLDMTRDVEAEHPGGHTDLLGGQSDATRGDQLGGKQIGDELNRGGLARVDVAPRIDAQDGSAHNRARLCLRQPGIVQAMIPGSQQVVVDH